MPTEHSEKNKIRLSGPLERDSIVNGYGLRAVLWTQGCLKHCNGCQNPESWSLGGGFEVEIEEIKNRLREFEGQAGITFCGGEPFLQPEGCKEVADFCRNELGWNVWSFSGYTYEEIMEKGDVVLLSPASASWDQYKECEVRGAEFKGLVGELKNGKNS